MTQQTVYSMDKNEFCVNITYEGYPCTITGEEICEWDGVYT